MKSSFETDRRGNFVLKHDAYEQRILITLIMGATLKEMAGMDLK